MSYRDLAFEGKPLPCRIVDAHTHVDAYFLKGWQQKNHDLSSFVHVMDQLGIDCAVTAPHDMISGRMQEANLRVVECCKAFPGRFYGYISVVPMCGLDEVKAELDTYKNNPAFVGMKFLASYHGNMTQKEYQYALDVADEMHCPVLVHTWKNDPPIEEFEDVVKRRHNMKLVLAHQCGGFAENVDMYVPLIQNYPNFYVELCGSLNNTYSVDEIAERFGADRLIFGTDFMNLDAKYELGRVAFSELSDPEKEMIFAENFLNLLKDSRMGRITFSDR